MGGRILDHPLRRAPSRGNVAILAPPIERPSAVSVRGDHVAAFTSTVAPHLRAAYGLARWLLGNDHDAEDAAQDAYMRAFRHFDGWNGTNARAWLLMIVRRCCYTLLARTRPAEVGVFDEETAHPEAPGQPDDPERAALRADDARLLNRAVAALPVEYREVFVLRELEGLSYREIADVAGIPIGTVMSRLSRARAELQRSLRAKGEKS
jgi:RNA polymerase sigma-70 factor, ECF subfamily